MERYFNKRSRNDLSEGSTFQESNTVQQPENVRQPSSNINCCRGFNLEELSVDPGKRTNIYEYDVNVREIVRRHYLQKGPCQPKNHIFPWSQNGEKKRRFVISWFEEHGSWLEYSVSKDAAFCLCCYLFKPKHGVQGGGDTFVSEGFSNWKKATEKFKIHVGDHNSIHFKCMKACEDLMKKRQHVDVCLSNQSEQQRLDSQERLVASIKAIRFLLRQEMPFRGHDESEDSDNKGCFLELLSFMAELNEDVRRVVLQRTSPPIQKDIINAIAVETTNAIVKDIGEDVFSILVDESRDISVKEQIAVVLRYVNKKGCVIERFLGISHVPDTTSLSLKVAIEEMFAKNGLSMSSIRGQGYDGASNMQGEFKGLKSLILAENSSAFFIHCFAHQLQLTLVAVAQSDRAIATFFNLVTMLSNVVGASCRRRDVLREKQIEKLKEGINSGEIETSQGLNQEMTLKCPGDTRWGSYYGTLMSCILLFSSVVDVLEFISQEGREAKQRGDANLLLEQINCFDFAFLLHSLKDVLGVSVQLSQALQMKDQDIINAMELVSVAKKRLQIMRESGWESLLDEVSMFCNKHNIVIPKIEDEFVARGRPRRTQGLTHLHHYRVDVFYAIIDSQLQELNSRFNELNTELLLCMACLDPRDSFSAFDKVKLVRFAEFYPSDFSAIELMDLGNQLETYIIDVRSNERFSEVIGIGGLAQAMVETRKHLVYTRVYMLIKLALVLPVATASVERVFSVMKLVKTDLHNRMGDELVNDCLVAYIEKGVTSTIPNEAIVQRFQNIKS